MRDPAISELLRECDTAQAVATQIDALAARLLEAAGGAIEPPQPRERYVLAGMRLKAAIPAVLAMLGVRVA